MNENTGYKQKLENKYNLKIFTDNIEYECLEQIETLLKQDVFKDSKIRIMPDTHAGKGCVIGFAGNLDEKVIPNIVRSRYRLFYRRYGSVVNIPL